jgi:hypothetical protein
VRPQNGILLAFLFAFGTTLAWLTGTPLKDRSGSGNSRQTEQLHELAGSSSSAADAIIARSERELIYGPDPVPGNFSAAGIERTIRQCASLPGGDQAIFSYLEQWTALDPRGVFAWFDRRGSPGGRFLQDYDGLRASMLFRIWAEQDLEAALTAAARLKFPGRRAQGLATTLQALAKTDPDRAREFFKAHLALFASIPGLYLDYDYYDKGAAALNFLSSIPSGKARGNLLASLLQTLSSAFSPVESSKFWEQAPDGVKQDLVAAGFSAASLADTRPDGRPLFPDLENRLRQQAEISGDPGAAEKFVDTYGYSWAARDLDSALAWSRTHLKGRARLESSAGFFYSAAEANFDHAVLTWQSLPPGILKAKAAGALLAGTPDARKADAEALLETLSPHDLSIAQQSAADQAPR